MNLVPIRKNAPAINQAETGGEQTYPHAEEQPKIFFLDILAAIYRQRKPALVAACVTAGLIGAAVFFMTPLYKSSASVMLDTRREEVVDLQAVLSTLPSDSYVVDSEVEILKSPTLAKMVVDRLELTKDPEFNASLRRRSPLNEAIGSLTSLARNALVSAGLLEPPDRNAARRTEEAVINAFREKLDVNRVGLTYVMTITFWSEDGDKAARIANAVADAYIAQQLAMKSRATARANALLKKRADELRVQVHRAERAVADYKAKNGLVSFVGGPLAQQEISALNTELATARAEEAKQQGKLAAALAQAKGGFDTVGEAASSDTIRELRVQQAKILQREADLKKRYGALHPALLQVQREHEAINGALSAEVSRIIDGLRAQAQSSSSRTQSLVASIERNRKILTTNSAAGVGLAELERDAQSVRTLYESFFNRYKQTSAQEGIQEADAQVVSRAMSPLSPAYPPKKLAFAGAMVLGLLAGAFMVVFREMMDRGVKSPGDAENAFGLPVLAVIPSVTNGDPDSYVVDKPMSAFAEAFRNLRTSLFLTRTGTAPKVVCLTSAIPGEGKTNAALSLGRQAASSGARVVIVDADIRRHSLSARLSCNADKGLLELLSGAATLDECLQTDPVSGASILPIAGRRAEEEKDAFFAHDLGAVFNQLRSRFDVIVVDTAPLLPLAEPRIIANYADAVVLLARWHHTSRSAVADAVRLVRSVDVPLAGLALTCVDLKELDSFGYSARTHNYQAMYRKYYVG